MTTALRLYTFATVAAAGLVLAAVTFLFPLKSDIGGPSGLAFWIVLTTVASAMPVRLPQGTLVGVSMATLLGSMVLGGPLAAAWTGALGTFEVREVSGRVPWYGTAFNHAVFVLAGAAAGLAYLGVAALGPSGPLAGPVDFLALAIAAAVFFLVNNVLVTQLISLRTGKSFQTIWVQDVQGIAPNLLALAPLGWLMAQIFKLPGGVGWWATPLFVVPLYTTRLAYNRYVESRQLFIETVSALANAVDARDKYTHGHSRRVMRISGAMSRMMKVPEAMADRIEWASLLHDIGKIGIRDNILLKEGPLSPEEKLLMNQHPSIGAEIVAPTRQLASEAPLIRAHHEWWNGGGYPDGVAGTDIPMGARIMTIADAYEAMTSSRPYRKIPLTHNEAIAELYKFSGIQFDPDIVPVLVNLERSVLDPLPVGPDPLPTLRHLPPMGTPEPDNTAAPVPAPAPASTARPARPATRSAGVNASTTSPKRRRSTARRPSLASSDDVS